jgi:DNA-binding beta-propeller fold protein YncE
MTTTTILTFAASVLLALTGIDRSIIAPASAPPPHPTFSLHDRVYPSSAVVFAGASIRFRAQAAGVPNEGVRWSVIGPGSISADGTFRAPLEIGADSYVVASTVSGEAGAPVRVARPPASDVHLAIVSCYDDGGMDVRSTPGLAQIGDASTGGRASGIVIDPALDVAFAAVDERVATLDLRTGAVRFSAAVAGARFSEVAMLGANFVAATDNDASAGQPGVRIFRIEDRTAGLLAGSSTAGDTPEGIAALPDGSRYYISSVNSNTVTEFAFDGRGGSRVVRTVGVGHRPFGIALDAAHGMLFVVDNDTSTVSGAASKPGLEAYALPALRRVADIATGSPDALPLGVATDPGADRVFVTNEGDGSVVAYSVSPLRKVGEAAVSGTPWLPAVDTARHLLYVPSASVDAFSVYDDRSMRAIAKDTPTCGYPVSIAVR